MSAFIVDKAHIDAMLSAGLAYGRFGLRWFAVEYGSEDFDLQRDRRELSHSTADQTGGMLVAENVTSVAHRYSPAGRVETYGHGWEDNLDLPGPLDKYYVEPYRYPVMGAGRTPTAVETLKLIDCYEYQSCEHPDWPNSEAKRFCEALRSAAIHALPGYEDGPWEWSSEAPSAPQTPEPEPEPEPTGPDYGDRNEAIKAIRAALKKRSGKAWSVTGGRGTDWGWITIEAPPRRRVENYYTSEAECAELAQLLGLENVHNQGVSIPASGDYRREYVARAQGRTPDTYGTQYWD